MKRVGLSALFFYFKPEGGQKKQIYTKNKKEDAGIEPAKIKNMTKYELTVSTGYVPNWTYIEAMRELFQNALDQETKDPRNKMVFEYDSKNERVTIGNKTSVLDANSLLLGFTTKADDSATIGQHGEGYKIAFMVLLREGKAIHVLNYGKQQEWEVKLVKSRRFSGCMVPTVYVEKKMFWEPVPDRDLTIVVDGITPDEWTAISECNLHLLRKKKVLQECEAEDYGRVLLDGDQSGRVYVKGLYVCTVKELCYGYDLEPQYITLDRDRSLIRNFDLVWRTSSMWKSLWRTPSMQEYILGMIKDGRNDVYYLKSVGGQSSIDKEISHAVFKIFQDDNPGCYPHYEGMEERIEKRAEKAEMSLKVVNKVVAEYIAEPALSMLPEVDEEDEGLSLKERFNNLYEKIYMRLTDEEVEEFLDLIDEIED